MEPRLIVAYSLMLLMALLIAAIVGYRIYHAHERSYRRRLRKEHRFYAELEAKAKGAPESQSRP